MSIDSIRWLCSLAVLVGALVIIALERAFPYNQGQRFLRPQFWNDLALYTLIQNYLLGFVISYVIVWIDGISGLSRMRLVGDWGIGWQLVFFIVLHDLYIYLFHRLQHKSKYLWRIHEAHHSAVEVDWLSGARSHSAEIFINQTVEFGVIILLGATAELAVIKAALDGLVGMYIHSNINIRSGLLRYIINGPEMHRWHHATDIDAQNKNFSTKLAIWDWLFGTAFSPQGRKPNGYGIDNTEFPTEYLHQHFYALRKFEQD